MKPQILLSSVLVCALLLAVSCSDVSEQETKVEAPDQEAKVEVAFTKQVEVFGLHIYATNTTGDDKLLHAANVLAEYIDNDEDGIPDNPKIMDALLEGKGNIVMTKTGGERRLVPRGERPRGQGLYDEETIPNARTQGRFDGAWEEILHMVTDVGWAGAYPDVFGREPGTEISNALDKARGGRFEEVPDEYPEDAWFTYDDETCDYDCMNSEYIYWALTSRLGAQDYPGRLEQIGREWRLNTREKVKERDPAVYAILTNPEYKLPTVLPDGKYKAGTFTIQPYRHPNVSDRETKAEAAFTKQVEVFGLHIYATSNTGDDKVLHAARVLAEYLDNDEDGAPDNDKVLDALLSRNTCIVMAKNEEELASIPRDSRPRGQALFDRETFPNAAEDVFDVTLEEILHPITGRGYALAYPEAFGTESGTAVAEALDLARGGHFEEVPEEYPEGAWFTYDDETCRYRCMITEYMYWALTSILGAQDIPGRLDRIGNEWRLNTREKVKERDPAIYALLTNPEYKFPTVIPDGKYKAGTFTIQPYSR